MKPGNHGILTAAYRAKVPIFCPAIADSSIGMGLSQARHRDQTAGHGRRHRRHHRVGQHRHPQALDGDDRPRRRHAQELHQPGERPGRVLRRSRRRPQVRDSDRHRRAAFRRRQRVEPRRGAELGQAVDGIREGHGAVRRDASRCRFSCRRSKPRRAKPSTSGSGPNSTPPAGCWS